MNIIDLLSKILPLVRAEAHCDIPCGIYEPTPAKIAAKTVQRMVLQLKELESKKEVYDHNHGAIHDFAAIQRRIMVKEEHAKLCKHELYTLWSDFFKPEHAAKFPELHDLFWKATKLCSKVRQEVSEESAKALVEAVDGIAKIFYEAKGDPNRYHAYQEITDKLF